MQKECKRSVSLCIASYSRMYEQNFRSFYMIIHFTIRLTVYLHLSTAKITLGTDINRNAKNNRTPEYTEGLYFLPATKSFSFILVYILFLVHKY